MIRNAEVIAARDSSLMNPGTVDVAVFPPISVAEWTVDDLAERIAGIRQLYLDTLKNWPAETLPDIAPYLVPAKKASTQKAAAKKAPAKKAPAKKAQRAAAKKAAPRAAAQQAPAKKTPRGRQ